MNAPQITLSLQFARGLPDAAVHRRALSRVRARRWLQAALQADAPAQCAFTVRVVDRDEGRTLNQTYRGKDDATNVLTFDYQIEPSLEADLVLCAPVVAAEAAAAQILLHAHYAHLIVHGALHAQGWDHENDEDAQVMELREAEILARLGLPDPYAERSA